MRSAENPYAGQGPVLLDVGGDVGALLVTMPASWEGVEIEIRPRDPSTSAGSEPDPLDHLVHSHVHQGEPAKADALPATAAVAGHHHADYAHLTHVEVLPRPTSDGSVHCAVFPDLTQGHYELSERPFSQVALEVTVVGGQIAQVPWPTSEPPSAPR